MTEPKPGQKFRPKVMVLEVTRYDICDKCKGQPEHVVEHWVQWWYGERLMREAVCDLRIASVLKNAYAAIRTTGIPNLLPAPQRVSKPTNSPIVERKPR